MKHLFLPNIIALPPSGFARGWLTNPEGCLINSSTGLYNCNDKGVIGKEAKIESSADARIRICDYDCIDFTTQVKAQNAYDKAGGKLINLHDLNCESARVACGGI